MFKIIGLVSSLLVFTACGDKKKEVEQENQQNNNQPNNPADPLAADKSAASALATSAEARINAIKDSVKVDSVEKEIKELRDLVANKNADKTGLDNKVNSLKQAAKLAEIERIDNKVAEADEAVKNAEKINKTKLGNHITGIEAKSKALADKKNETDLNITAIDTVVGELDGLLAQLKNDDTYKNGAQGVILGKFTTIKDDIKDKTKVDDTQLKALVKELEDLKSTEKDVTDAIVELKAEQTSRELSATKYDAKNGKVKDANDLYDNAKYTDAKFNVIKAAFKGAIDNATGDIDAAANKEAVEQKLATLAAAKQTFEKEAENIEKAIQNVDAKIAEINTAVTNAQTAIQTPKHGDKNPTTKVEELIAKAKKDEEIKKLTDATTVEDMTNAIKDANVYIGELNTTAKAFTDKETELDEELKVKAKTDPVAAIRLEAKAAIEKTVEPLEQARKVVDNNKTTADKTVVNDAIKALENAVDDLNKAQSAADATEESIEKAINDADIDTKLTALGQAKTDFEAEVEKARKAEELRIAKESLRTKIETTKEPLKQANQAIADNNKTGVDNTAVNAAIEALENAVDDLNSIQLDDATKDDIENAINDAGIDAKITVLEQAKTEFLAKVEEARKAEEARLANEKAEQERLAKVEEDKKAQEDALALYEDFSADINNATEDELNNALTALRALNDTQKETKEVKDAVQAIKNEQNRREEAKLANEKAEQERLAKEVAIDAYKDILADDGKIKNDANLSRLNSILEELNKIANKDEYTNNAINALSTKIEEMKNANDLLIHNLDNNFDLSKKDGFANLSDELKNEINDAFNSTKNTISQETLNEYNDVYVKPVTKFIDLLNLMTELNNKTTEEQSGKDAKDALTKTLEDNALNNPKKIEAVNDAVAALEKAKTDFEEAVKAEAARKAEEARLAEEAKKAEADKLANDKNNELAQLEAKFKSITNISNPIKQKNTKNLVIQANELGNKRLSINGQTVTIFNFISNDLKSKEYKSKNTDEKIAYLKSAEIALNDIGYKIDNNKIVKK